MILVLIQFSYRDHHECRFGKTKPFPDHAAIGTRSFNPGKIYSYSWNIDCVSARAVMELLCCRIVFLIDCYQTIGMMRCNAFHIPVDQLILQRSTFVEMEAMRSIDDLCPQPFRSHPCKEGSQRRMRADDVIVFFLQKLFHESVCFQVIGRSRTLGKADIVFPMNVIVGIGSIGSDIDEISLLMELMDNPEMMVDDVNINRGCKQDLHHFASPVQEIVLRLRI